MSTALANPVVISDRALDDGLTAYSDLSRHHIEIQLEDDGWHIEFRFRGTGRFHTGGGPAYVIDANTGEILSKKYYQ